MAESNLVFRLLGVDAGASRAIAGVGKAAEAASLTSASAAKRSEAAWAKMGAAANMAGKLSAALVVGVAYEGVKMAGNFEQAMARVHTQAGAPISDIKSLGDELLKLAPKVGVGPVELADSLYHVESAGFRAKGEVLGMVEAAAKLSQIGGANLGESTQAIIGTLASGIKGVHGAMDAVALLNTTVGIGDMKMPQLVKAIGTDILPTARAVGLSFEDIGAALATIGDNATPVDQVATRLKTSLLTLIKPSNQQVQAFQQIGMTGLQLASDFQKPNGLLVAVKDLKTHLDATYPAGQKTALTMDQVKQASTAYYNDLVTHGTNVKDATKLAAKYTETIKSSGSTSVMAANTLARALGGSKTAGVFLTLIAEADRLGSKYHDLGDESSRAAKLQDAWATQQGTYKQKVADLKAAWDVFLVQVGNALIPALKSIVTWLSKHPGIIKDVAVAVGIMAAAWGAWKIGSLIANVSRFAGALLGMGRAAEIAAGANAIGGIESSAAGAAKGVAGIGTAFAGSGMILGGVAILGTLALAAGVKQIFTNIHEGLPDLGKLTAAIAGGGLSGQQGQSAISQSLQDSSSGDNRKESQLQYFNRVTTTLDPKTGTSFGKDVNLNMDRLFRTIQTGDVGTLQAFIADLRKISTLTGASPDVVYQQEKYFTDLFNRYNSGRAASKAYADQQKKNTANIASYYKSLNAAAAGTTTSTDQLTKSFHLSASETAKLADANKWYAVNMENAGKESHGFADGIGSASDILRVHSRDLKFDFDMVKSHAEAVFKATGNAEASNAVFAAGVATIEANAVSIGMNKNAVNDLARAVLGLPPSKDVPISLPGIDAAASQLRAFLEMLARIPAQQTVNLQVMTSGSASPAAIANAVAGGSHGAGYAVGTPSAPPGMAWVGERGPELMRMRGGEQVYTNAQSMAMAGGGGVTVNIQAWDGQSVDRWLTQGGTTKIAHALQRAGVNGMRVNS
jgi:TP901 family phage tail tape measure protein